MAGAARGSQILELDQLSLRFGGVTALDSVSFSVAPQSVCALIGPNGAGKTTLFNVVSRLLREESGTVWFCGQALTEVKRQQIAGLGIARTFQNLGLFPALSVIENVLVGAQARMFRRFGRALRACWGRAEAAALRAEAAELLAELGLADAAERRPADLPFGSQKKIELARALIARPRLLMLDEPANGLAHGEVYELADLLLSLKQRLGLSLLLVEHHVEMVTRIADKVVVLDFGRKIAEGTPAEVAGNQQVIEAYLGRPA